MFCGLRSFRGLYKSAVKLGMLGLPVILASRYVSPTKGSMTVGRSARYLLPIARASTADNHDPSSDMRLKLIGLVQISITASMMAGVVVVGSGSSRSRRRSSSRSRSSSSAAAAAAAALRN